MLANREMCILLDSTGDLTIRRGLGCTYDSLLGS
jgi:hypothetical protein